MTDLPKGWYAFRHTSVWTGDGNFTGDTFYVNLLDITRVLPHNGGKESQFYCTDGKSYFVGLSQVGLLKLIAEAKRGER